MARLSYARRKKLPASAFAIPEKRKYPIYDRTHARNALARVSRFGSPAEKRRVRMAVKRRYPDMEVSGLNPTRRRTRRAHGRRK